jgi:hypothetical protein
MATSAYRRVFSGGSGEVARKPGGQIAAAFLPSAWRPGRPFAGPVNAVVAVWRAASGSAASVLSAVSERIQFLAVTDITRRSVGDGVSYFRYSYDKSCCTRRSRVFTDKCRF